jgi:hypothetical protein
MQKTMQKTMRKSQDTLRLRSTKHDFCFGMRTSLFVLTLLVTSIFAQSAPSLKAVHKVFIEPNHLDEHLRAEFSRQMSGRILVMLREEDAEAIITITGEEGKGLGARIVGRGLGLRDASILSLSLLDKERRVILWSGEAGDRSMMFGAVGRGGERNIAERLVRQLKKAIGN